MVCSPVPISLLDGPDRSSLKRFYVKAIFGFPMLDATSKCKLWFCACGVTVWEDSDFFSAGGPPLEHVRRPYTSRTVVSYEMTTYVVHNHQYQEFSEVTSNKMPFCEGLEFPGQISLITYF